MLATSLFIFATFAGGLRSATADETTITTSQRVALVASANRWKVIQPSAEAKLVQIPLGKTKFALGFVELDAEGEPTLD